MECLHQLFSLQASRTPNLPAVVDPDRCLTFAELDTLSDVLAASLQAFGVGLDDTVGLFMEKSVDYVVGCLAALKAGGSFLPLFLDYPDMQLDKIVEQTRTKVVLTTKALKDRLPRPETMKIVLMDQESSWPRKPYRPAAVTEDNLMFVVYTSGTTGEPKGIQLPHRAAVHSYRERNKICPYKPGQRVACNIFFVWEIFRPLIQGASVYVISDDIIYDPRLLTEFLELNQITEVLFTPSLMETMLNHLDLESWKSRLNRLEVIWLNGEVVTEKLRAKALRALAPGVGLYNTYSISECHDVASLDLRSAETSPTGFCRVGYPIEGISVYLMNPDGQPAPKGTTGELYVGGPGLARGYLGKPHLTAERFVHFQGERLYRTGDLAYQYADGLLEIRGRCDSMVKIRGYSVHLGATQSALEKLPSVQSAAVVALGEEGKDKRLIAYVVGSPDRAWTVDPQSGACPQLRDQLRAHLAEFMLPNLFVELEALPLSPTTGKLDASRLPSPANRVSYGVDDMELAESATLAEKQVFLATLWERLLGLDPGVVKPDSNFFDLGGHSLMAVRLAKLIERKMSCILTVKQLYDHPTVKQLTNLIHTGQEAAASDALPLTQDWTLDPNLSPIGEPVTLNKAKGILVTGATGFLGAFLTHRLLQETDCTVYCLVRPTGRPAQERLEQNMQGYGLEISARLRALPGDLSKDNLGLSADDYTMLGDQTDLVFHCGAAVNYVHTYPVLKPHTVDGTLEILKLCCQEPAKTLHYVSTNGIFPGGETYYESPNIDEHLDGLSNGYGYSKWVAEKLVQQACQRGLPVVIYRPGNIGHHSQTGVSNSNDFQTLILRGCLATGLAPDVPAWNFEMTPVDFLANAMACFANDAEMKGHIFHIVQNPTVQARRVFEQLLSNRHIEKIVPLEIWLERLLEVALETEDSKLEVLANSLEDVEGYLTDTSRYHNERFLAALDRHQLGRPQADVNYYCSVIGSLQPSDNLKCLS
jgi:amino acid adenylation domain-containing protein/thioester reductase-like protein